MNNTIEDVLILSFCMLDDFCNSFESEWHAILLQHTDPQKLAKTTRIPSMTLSEIISTLQLVQLKQYELETRQEAQTR